MAEMVHSVGQKEQALRAQDLELAAHDDSSFKWRKALFSAHSLGVTKCGAAVVTLLYSHSGT